MFYRRKTSWNRAHVQQQNGQIDWRIGYPAPPQTMGCRGALERGLSTAHINTDTPPDVVSESGESQSDALHLCKGQNHSLFSGIIYTNV